MRLAPYLFQIRNDADLKQICRSYIDWMPLSLFSEPVGWWQQLFNTQNRFRNRFQRPHSFYIPHLKGLPFHPSDRISQHLEKNWETISNEFSKVAHMEVSTPSINLIDAGTWNTFPLMRSAKRITENIERCPNTWMLVQQCTLLDGIRGGVYFSIIYPGTHIDSHCGPSNLKLRYHLTIVEAEHAKIRSGDTWKTWRQGECLILDDSFEHEVLHQGNQRRVVLIVDCWHPDLTEKEKEFLIQVHNIWRREN